MRRLVPLLAVLSALAGFADDYSRPVRPGGEGRPFWNAKAVRFMYAPSFDFKAVTGAVRYRYEILDDNDGARTFVAARPTESLASVWAELPVGWTRVTCVGLDGDGRAVGKAGERTFWKKSGYRPCAAKPKRGYGEAAALARRFVLTMPQADHLVRTGKPDHSYVLNGYPSKILSAEIGAAVALGRLDFARAAADHLIATRQPAGTPLESFPPTYEGKGEYGRSEKFKGRNMLVYPAEAGVAFLKLGACTGEGKYLAAAEAIAARYLKLQGADGTWPVVVDERDGRPVFPNRLIPTGVIDFLEQMYERTKRPEYRQAADRAFAFIERGPLVDWNWSAQYEDSPVAPPYENLTLHEAAWTAMYLLRRRPGDAKSLATARELARFCEDQFVCWENPYAHGRDPKWYDGERRGAPDWCVFPCALEQYACYIPIDACAARMVQLHLALYRAEGRPEDLERARAFGAAIVAAQGDDGYIATFWCDRLRRDNEAYHMWVNCMLFSADALDRLEDRPLKFLFMTDHHVESDFVQSHGLTKGEPVYTMWKPGNHAALVETYRFINADPDCRDIDFALFGGDQVNTGYTKDRADLEAEMANYRRTLEALDVHAKTKGRTDDFDFVARPWTVRENLGPEGRPYEVSPTGPVSRVIAIQGNHDTGVDSFYRDCAFTAGDVRFIAFFASYVGLPPLPGEPFRSTAKISDETLAFVEGEMRAAAENPRIRHIVLVSHWAIAPTGADFTNPILGPCKENGMNDNRRKLLESAEKYGADLFINGHEHAGRYPVGKAGRLFDVNCGTLTANPRQDPGDPESGGAFSIVEIRDDKAVFTVYSRAAVEEKDGVCRVVARPRRLFAREVPLKPIR